MLNIQIENTIAHLYKDSEKDYLKMMKAAAKSTFRPLEPSDLKDAYLSISKDQGVDLVETIKKENIKNIVEFGTSFGISTLFLAQGVAETGGSIITTELIESKAKKAKENFKAAGVNHLVDLRVGDALVTLNNHSTPIDLLLLDGWKDLYLPLFQLLEPNYHDSTIVYVDNADMGDSQVFLKNVSQNSKYQIEYKHNGKVALIRMK